MNQIEDERIKFFFEHETRIMEWAELVDEVSEFVDSFYRSLEGDLVRALRNDNITYSGVEVFLTDGNYSGLGLRREDWPEGDQEPDVRLEWHRKPALFSEDGWLICGVRTNVNDYRVHFTKAARPDYPEALPWWPSYRYVDPPKDRFWEGDNLKEYRAYLVKTTLKAWSDLSSLVDEAVGHRSS